MKIIPSFIKDGSSIILSDKDEFLDDIILYTEKNRSLIKDLCDKNTKIRVGLKIDGVIYGVIAEKLGGEYLINGHCDI